MTSDRKRESNQENSRLSTGPRDTSQTRFNAVNHGILSSEVLIRNGLGKEDRNLFEAIRAQLIDDLQPVGEIEEFLIEKIVINMWRSRRLMTYETEVWEQATNAVSAVPKLTKLSSAMHSVQRYESHISRQYYQALHELERLQAYRLGKPADVPTAIDISVN
jgi:hypothetical protein